MQLAMDIPLAPTGPHAAIPARNAQEQFLARLWDRLWYRYRQRVPAVGLYEQMVQRFQGTFVNDHVAFRTFANQQPWTGIASLSRIFEALGYVPAGLYSFPDKHLQAIHYQHPNTEFPKLFVSELQVWRLPEPAQRIVERTLADHRTGPARQLLANLQSLEGLEDLPAESYWHAWLSDCVGLIEERPWSVPDWEDLSTLNSISQYAAWALVHGYNVNHFTALINSHGVQELQDIERTVQALRDAGVEMKVEIEGAPGSKLRQTATNAALVDVEVHRHGVREQVPWTYAYFELAERGEVPHAETGKLERFEGFLGPQATQLFEMTKRKE
jgi:hypothetical protein